MAAVELTISKTLDGLDIGTAGGGDALAGGSNYGLDYGSVVNNSYAPIISKAANTGRHDLYIAHNASIDPINNVKIYLGQYGVLTGFPYGGARSAAIDYSTVKTLGQNSGGSKNNNDGLSGGIWADMRAIVSDANQFDKANFPTKVMIFGDNGTDGIDLTSGFPILTEAMVYNNSGETQASAAVEGSIGKAADTVLGDSAHIRTRVYLPANHIEGGIFQQELVVSYSYTS